MKRKKIAKPRSTTITMDMGIPVQIKSVSVAADGSFEFLDENGKSLHPARTTLERNYERLKGPKVLSRIPLDSEISIKLDPNFALQKYDTLFVLDTNTRRIQNREISVAAFVLAKWTERFPTPKLGFAPVHALEFHNVDCHPDLLALKHLIHQMDTDPRRLMAGRIGIIIDSHLGNFSKIVSRELAILDECFFPEWADLIYASDAAADSISNILLQASDRAANSLLRQIEGDITDSISQIEKPDHASYFRVWHFSSKR